MTFKIMKNLHKKRREYFHDEFIWSGLRGSNSLPPPWQGGALPDELNPHSCQRIVAAFLLPLQLNLVPPIGIEPMTRGFSVLCSTD